MGDPNSSSHRIQLSGSLEDAEDGELVIDLQQLEPECIMQEESSVLPVDTTEIPQEFTSPWSNAPYWCVRCGFTTEELKLLIEHTKKHVGFTPYSCALCGYQTRRYWNIKNHMVTHTGKGNLYSCPLCEFVSSYMKNVKRHLRLHVRNGTYVADKNGPEIPPIRRYSTNPSPVAPSAVQAANGENAGPLTLLEKIFRCELCTYKTAYHSNLVRHSRKHTGERPFPCPRCEYRALQHSDLTRHFRTHTGEKPYTCRLCDYKTAQAGDLTVHTKRHVGSEIYECFVCGFKSIQKSYVTKHINQMHGQDLMSHVKKQ